MNLKKFNKETQTWDIIASGNASGIVVTDPHFVNEGDVQKSVNDVLVEMDNKIEQTRRNLSWVVQNGTIGGGGGGGSIESSIKLTNANISTIDGVNYLYATTQSVTLNYLITAKIPNQRYTINVALDGTYIIVDQVGYSSIAGDLVINNIAAYSSNTSHSVVITVTDQEGISLEPYMLTIVESSISLKSSVTSNSATIGAPFNITYAITNKMLGTDTSLIVTNEAMNITKIYEVGKFGSATPKTVTVNFFDLFGETTPGTGSTYTIKAQATTTVDGQTVYSNITSNTIVIQNSTDLVVLVEGISKKGDEEITKFSQSGNIQFSFTPYLSNVNIIYYAIQIKCGELVSYIGNNFGATDQNFTDNPWVIVGRSQTISWSIPQEDAYIGDYEITLKCWSEAYTPNLDAEDKQIKLVCEVVAATNSLLPTQIPNNNTLYAQWHIKQASFPTDSFASRWISNIPEFTIPGEQTPSPSITNLNVYDTNGVLSGFMTENGQSKLRLVGESYGVIDVQPFTANKEDNWCSHGFTFSITFKTDTHPYNDRSVFFIGQYDNANQLQEGIWVGLEEVIWKYTDGNTKQTISCKIQQNVPTTIDFVMQSPLYGTGEVKIFVNGILNVAREIHSEFTWNTESKMYLACTNYNEGVSNFSDVEFYEIKLFRQALNDKQIVINALNANARATLLPTGSVDFTAYNQEKQKNFFDITSNTTNTILWDDIDVAYKNVKFVELQNNSALPLPVILLDCTNSGFTKEVYSEIGSDTRLWENCTMQYFDPKAVDVNGDKHATVSTETVTIQKQGTSSMNYRSKNLEIILNKDLLDEQGNIIGKELFQPKETWMPENQFTLKADVVDSAHANNAAIGSWINDHADTLFSETPPMQELRSHRPVDTYTGVAHDKVTIKHTLEGFPVILLVKFDKSSSEEMLGIYSFNLGRGAYYNMGMKFFKNFTSTKKNVDGTFVEERVPAFIKSYETYSPNERFGSILPSQIYSYEFGENANTIQSGNELLPLALFMQDDMSIIQHVGEFKYNGSTQDATPVTDNAVWQRLQSLFKTLAEMTAMKTDKYKWDAVNKGYVKTGATYAEQTSFSGLGDELRKRLNIRNAYSYFMICIAFGLVDSLGKNMVLRSWNVGESEEGEKLNMWWPCFYDMDTANGLSNTGEENVAKTAYIDGFSNKITEAGVNALAIKYNDPDGGYDTYSSRLWDVLRNNLFIRADANEGYTYDNIWNSWRSNLDMLNSSTTFVDKYFSSQTKNCGQLLYNYDYKIKYLTKYQKDENSVPSYANIEFLHGTRNNYVRDWLKKRLTFFDGVFFYNNGNVLLPYNTTGQFKCGGSEESNPELIIKLNSPAILNVNVGNTSQTRYFVDENVDTSILLPPLSSYNTQILLNNTPEISKIDGLTGIRFQGFMDITLPSMSELDLNNVTTLSSKPVLFESIFIKKIGDTRNSDIRHIDLSNTAYWSGNSGTNEFPVNIESYLKLKTLDISNSCVTSLSLPNAALSELKIYNSIVEKINLEDQPFIDEVDFTGCSKLQTVSVSNCNKISRLDLKNMPNLTTVTIIGCQALKEIILSGCPKLTSISVSNAAQLVNVDLSNCSNSELNIDLTGASSLTTLNLSNTTTSKVVKLPVLFDKLTSLNLYSSNITSLQYGAVPVATFNGEPVLDLSPFNLTYLNLQYNSSKYIKFLNGKSKCYDVNTNTFNGCSNLTRVFGHINITSGGVFDNNSLFRIHDFENDTEFVEGLWYGPDTDTEEGLIQWNNNEQLSTNIKLSTSSLDSCFSDTECNLYDMYYIMSKCQNVTNLNNTFRWCNKIVTSLDNPLRRDTFKYCGNVTTATTLFYSTNIAGPLYSPTHNGDTITNYNGLLSPLKKLTNPNGMFMSNGKKYIDDLFFSKCSATEYLKFTNINSLFSDSENDDVAIVDNCDESLTSANVSSRRKPARASKLLVNLPDLTQLSLVLNNIEVQFDLASYTGETGTVSYCPLIAHNTKLTSLSRSFVNIKGSGSLVNIFGGNVIFDNTSLFPRNISSVNKFIVISGYDNNPVYYPIHNNMFRQIKNSLQYFRHNATASSTATWGTTSFSGNGINKEFMPEIESETFPYDVFKECKKLIQCPMFFYNMQFKVTPTDVALPGDIFINNTELQDVQSCFRNIGSSDFSYTLTSKGFINCKLTNVNDIFNESTGTAKTGCIPYGLFYQEKKVNKTFEAGWTHTQAQALGMIDENFGLTEDGKYDESIVLEEPVRTTEQVTAINNTIQSMANALTMFKSSQARCYEREVYDADTIVSLETAKDLITYNDDYNPIEFIPNPTFDPNEFIPNPEYDENNPGDIDPVIENPAYDPRRVIKNLKYYPCHYVWNEWYYDGNYGLGDWLEETMLYSKVLDGSITDISAKLPDSFYNVDDNRKPLDPSGVASFESMNYICPVDLFRYCTTSANVNYCLSNSSDYTWAGGGIYRENGGIYGRIPKDLFKPLTTATTISHVFYNCHNVTPYTWNTETDPGNMFHPDIFANNKALSDVSGLFRGIYIPAKIVIPSTLFTKNTQLKNVSWLFGGCIFEGPADGNQQLNDSTFSQNRLIENISYMIAGSTSDSSVPNNQGPKKIGGSLFTSDKHKNITNLQGFLMRQSNTTGTLPAFWTWLNSTVTNRSGIFYGVRKANFTNGSEVPTGSNGWDANMI